jgi:hypothetical protein
VSALSGAVKALLRQLASLKSKLRREVLSKRKSRRAELRATKPLRFAAAPLASGPGPQNLGMSSARSWSRMTRVCCAKTTDRQWHMARKSYKEIGCADPQKQDCAGIGFGLIYPS